MKLDPWGSTIIKDYGKLFDEFGISRFKPLLSKVPDPSHLMERGILFGHRDFNTVLKAIKEKKSYAMMTGLMPSGKFHFGHKMVFDQIDWYQNHNAEIFLAVADIEAYTVRRTPLPDLKKVAIDEYLTNYIALGLKPKKCNFYFQSDWTQPYYRLSKMASQKSTFNQMKAIYGELSPGKIVSALTQVADILHPQLPEHGGQRPVVVPIGPDQDPHMRLARDIATRFQSEFKFFLPSSTYHRFMTGLDGGKMSSSKAESFIALTDAPDEACKKLKRAFTGGRDTLAEQKKKGGKPEICVVYEFLVTHLEPDEKKLRKLHADCKAGKIMCGDCKAKACDLMSKFLEKHQAKREKAKDKIDKFLKQ